jgi:hypothetical protein
MWIVFRQFDVRGLGENYPLRCFLSIKNIKNQMGANSKNIENEVQSNF